jgi:ATP synthase F1 delta subunit
LNKAQIAKKFSKALINKVDVSEAPKVIEELGLFLNLLDSDKNIRIFFVSQIFSNNEKLKALKDVLTHMNASAETGKFLNLVVTESVLSALKEIMKAAVALYEEKIRKVTAQVTAPVALDDSHMNRLKSALASITDRDVDIESDIDPSIIGGFIVKVGSTVYDSSIKGQLQLLKTELTR